VISSASENRLPTTKLLCGWSPRGAEQPKVFHLRGAADDRPVRREAPEEQIVRVVGAENRPVVARPREDRLIVGERRRRIVHPYVVSETHVDREIAGADLGGGASSSRSRGAE
jgi:hypothetical protein